MTTARIDNVYKIPGVTFYPLSNKELINKYVCEWPKDNSHEPKAAIDWCYQRATVGLKNTDRDDFDNFENANTIDFLCKEHERHGQIDRSRNRA